MKAKVQKGDNMEDKIIMTLTSETGEQVDYELMDVVSLNNNIYSVFYPTKEGETEVETALREVKEEVGLKAEIYEDYRYVTNYIVKDNINKEVVYFLADVDEDMIVTRPGEIDMAGWFTQKEALKAIEFENIREIINRAYEDSRKL